MSRKPRVHCDSGVYHVILRGNNQQNLFMEDEDRVFFIKRLKKYSQELKIEVYAYCLMSNHVHIMIGNAHKTLSLFVQKLANSYVYFFNHKYERSGHLFQGRFKSEPIINDEYFMTVFRYILQNSEKAGLGAFDSYKWNSFYAEKKQQIDFINTVYVIKTFGSKQRLLDFLALRQNDSCMEYENKPYLPDKKAFDIIKKVFDIPAPYYFGKITLEEQLRKCRILKEKGLAINQIQRLTGFARKIIREA